MIPIISLLVIIVLSSIVTRIATIALIYTGLSRESAQFQSRSAFTGVGFTTTEAETIVNHPVRRRIVMVLMLLGNAGFVSVVASVLLTFIGAEDSAFTLGMRVLTLAAAVTVLWALSKSRALDRWMSRQIARALRRWTDLRVRDFVGLLHLADNHEILELTVEPNDWMSERLLRDLRLPDEGVLVIGIQRTDGSYLGAPDGETPIEPGDRMILYGPEDRLAELDQRRRGEPGETAHREAAAEHARVHARQKERDRHRHDARVEEARARETHAG